MNNDPTNPPPALDDLIIRGLHGLADEAEESALAGQLATSSEARERFIDHAMLHGLLASEAKAGGFAADREAFFVALEAQPPARRIVPIHRWWWLSAAGSRGPLPWTTLVGFFNGKLQKKSDFGWPGSQETWQGADGTNGYGLHDMSGNVWQFINDWSERGYYAYSPVENPPGPAEGSVMPDGKAYRGMRGGNWFNGENGHGRVSNRNPSYYRGPQDPVHPYYHLGFRIALPVNAEARPATQPTPVQNIGITGSNKQKGNPGPLRTTPSPRPRAME